MSVFCCINVLVLIQFHLLSPVNWFNMNNGIYHFTSVLWHLDDRKGIRPVKSWVLVCWWWWFDWSFARLIAPIVTTTSIILSSNKIQDGDILVLANPAPPGKWPLKQKEKERERMGFISQQIWDVVLCFNGACRMQIHDLFAVANLTFSHLFLELFIWLNSSNPTFYTASLHCSIIYRTAHFDD